MRKFCVVGLLLVACSAFGASVKTGKERLRELVVVPTVNLTSSYNTKASRAELLEDYLVPGEIDRLQKELKAHPDDPERLLQLGALLDRIGETNQARACAEDAEKAARKKAAIRPRDGLTLTCLGEALDGVGKANEAESVFRKATLVSSNEWKCWDGLGHFLNSQGFNAILPKDWGKTWNGSLDSILSSIGSYQPTAEQLARAEKMRKESMECADRAVSLAPTEADAYLGRADIRIGSAVLEFIERHYRDPQPPDAAQAFQIYHPAGCIQDLREAARLCPDDYRVIAMAAWYETYVKLFEAVRQDPSQKLSIGILPNDTQVSLRGAMSRLEGLSQSADKERASGALESLGFLKTIIGDFAGAKVVLRRAVALEPKRDKAWELLFVAAVQTVSPIDECESIAESLVKSKNSARNRLLLGKALIKENRLKEAEVQIKLAAGLEPDSVLAHSMAAALAIKQSTDDAYLSVAASQIAQASELIQKMPSGQEKETRTRELLLNDIIMVALVDKPEDAKELLTKFLTRYPDDQEAKNVRGAIQ